MIWLFALLWLINVLIPLAAGLLLVKRVIPHPTTLVSALILCACLVISLLFLFLGFSLTTRLTAFNSTQQTGSWLLTILVLLIQAAILLQLIYYKRVLRWLQSLARKPPPQSPPSP